MCKYIFRNYVKHLLCTDKMMHLEYMKPWENAAALGSKFLWFLILVLLHVQCYLTNIFAWLSKKYFVLSFK